MRILLAEDDAQLSAMVSATLTASAFVVETADDGNLVYAAGKDQDFDAILLDLGLPSLDGMTILKRWRSTGVTTPVLVLTARDQWEERVEAIEAGADDYLVKPFRMEELAARLRAVLRRSSGFSSASISFGPFTIDPRLMRLSRDGIPIELTPQEYKVLAYLAYHRGAVVSQLELTEHVYAQDLGRNSNSIEVLIGRLRRRIGPDAIKTKRGFGYYVENGA